MKNLIKLFSNYGGGEGSECRPFVIKNAKNLALLAKMVNKGNTYKDKHFILKNDIDLKDVCGYMKGDWIPIGNSSIKNICFEGIFDGKNHRIENVCIDSTDSYQGLFGKNKGTIKNLILSGAVNGNSTIGGICAYNDGRIEECINECYITGTEYTGGVCGVNDEHGIVVKCKNKGDVNGEKDSGGISGVNKGIVDDCNNINKINSKGERTGGICGINDGRATIITCKNEGYVIGVDFVGGICGANGGKIDGCNNVNMVVSEKVNSGCVCSINLDIGEIINCVNEVDVNYDNDIAGICGSNSGKIDGCINKGNIMGNKAGGICLLNIENGCIINCSNEGYVKGAEAVGGVCTINIGKIEGCCNIGEMASVFVAGGICGLNNASSIISKCYNKGDVFCDGYSAGGICGKNIGTISDCYNIAGVNANGHFLGGVCGENQSGSIMHCYSTGAVKFIDKHIDSEEKDVYDGINESNCYEDESNQKKSSDMMKKQCRIGGICGANTHTSEVLYDGKINGCYYLFDSVSGGVEGKDITGQCESLKNIQFSLQESFVGWELDSVLDNKWEMNSVFGRPILKDNKEV